MASRNPKPRNRKKIDQKKVASYMIIAVIIIAVAFYLITYKGIQDIGSAGNVTISPNGAVFIMGGSEYSAYIGSGNILYVTKQPTFVNPTLAVSLSKGVIIHVNYMSKYSDMGIDLLSENGSAYNVHFSTISQSLAVPPDSGQIKTVSSNAIHNTTANVQSEPSNASLGSTTSTITSTTVTTTTAQPNSYDMALAALKKSAYYSLMQNYSELYQNTSKCTPALYNKTYEENNYGSTPSGRTTYQNISTFVPFNMTYSINDVAGPLYRVNYTTLSKTTISTGTALSMYINASSGKISNVTFSGIFRTLNQSMVYRGYLTAVRVGGACGIYIS